MLKEYFSVYLQENFQKYLPPNRFQDFFDTIELKNNPIDFSILFSKNRNS